MNPLSASILVVLCVIVLAGPRRAALLAIAAGVLYLTQGAAVNVAGLNIFAVRFLEVAGFVRVIARREFRLSELNGIDRALLLVYGFTTIVFLLRSQDEQAFQIGAAVDAYLAYFTFRGLIQNLEEFRAFLRSFILLLTPYVAIVMLDSFTHHNLFTLTGAAPDNVAYWSRNGRLRCFGSFRHPSLLGTIAVSFIPLYIGMAFAAVDRVRAFFAIGLCLMVVWASNSGGPASGVAAGVAAWLCWRVRTRMQLIRRGMVVLIVMAALLMKAPVWYLLEHVSAISGGDGWHRSFLLDTTWQHRSLWWLAGMPIIQTADWFPYNQPLTGGADITNLFVYFGLTAGTGAIVLFIVLLTRVYSGIGKSLVILRAAFPISCESEYFMWGLGCMLTGHIANWFGITYFDQTYVFWFMQLAAISTLTHNIQSPESPETAAALDQNKDSSADTPRLEPVSVANEQLSN